jgi:hypothetical protein
MDPIAARREVALEIEGLAEEFEKSDEAAFRRTRVACWAVTGVATALALIVLVAGGDWRYLGLFWAAVVGLAWAGHALSSRRQRLQTARLRALATRWLDGAPPAAG